MGPSVKMPEGLGESDKVWRYMDLAKLTSLLVSRSLWFSALWKLEDPFEGILPVPSTYARMDETAKAMDPGAIPDLAEMKHFSYFSAVQAIRLSTFVNCWNVEDSESIALWKIYGQDGIAIQTTASGLVDCLPTGDVPIIEIGFVDYQRDPENNPALTGQWPATALTKDLTYSYERELRLYFSDPEPIGPFFDRTLKPLPGRPVEVDLDVLIERIVVSPYQSEWFERLVRELLKRLEMNPDLVSPSNFRRQPVYRLGPSGGVAPPARPT